METKIVSVPQEIIDFKITHYKKIFKEAWQAVYNASPVLDKNEEILLIIDSGLVVAWCNYQKNIYNVRIRGFTVRPECTGRGVAKKLMHELEKIAISYHYFLLKAQKKPSDIGLMYLKSLIYLDPPDESKQDLPALQFGSFLKKMGFVPCLFHKDDLSPEEIEAMKIYQQLYPDPADQLRVFKKKVVDGGVALRDDIKQELQSLTPEQWDIVMGGLNWKLGHYTKSGKVSFRYDLCPICADMGSSEQDSENCKKCYIYLTCQEPFRAHARFKEDFEVSGAYFSAMKEFMIQNKPKVSP